jgi:hypothetical protein
MLNHTEQTHLHLACCVLFLMGPQRAWQPKYAPPCHVAGGHPQKEGAFPMKKLTQLMSVDDAAVGYIMLMQMLHLRISDLFVICAIQAVLGCALVAYIDMPWTLLGFILLLASAYTLKSIPDINEALEDGGAASD